MAKKQLPMKHLGRQHIREHLLRFHPFLRKNCRDLLKTELKSKEVYKELFGDEAYEPYKLTAIYEYQK